MSDDQDLRLRIIQSLARKRVVDAHKKRADTVKNWLATDEQGRVEDLIRETVRDPNGPSRATPAAGTTSGSRVS